MTTTLRKLVTLSALLLLAGVARAAPPNTFTYSGFLLDAAGNPVAGPASMTFKLYDAAQAGNTVYTETIGGIVPGADGFFSVVVGLQAAIANDAFQNARFLGVTYGTEAEMSPRIALTSVPSAFTALSAASATTAASVDWTGILNRPTSSCAGATPFVTGVGANGAVTCGAAPPGNAGCLTGQILKYSGTAWTCAADDAGAGSLTGIAPLAVSGGAISMAAADLVTPGYLTSTAFAAFAGKQARVIGTCGPGQYLTAIDELGGVTCGTDATGASALTGVTAGAGLTGGGLTGNVTVGIGPAGVDGTMLAPGAVSATHIADGSITLAKLGFTCLAGQVIMWDGTLGAWACNSPFGAGTVVYAVGTSGGLTVDGVPGGTIAGAGTLGIDTTAIQARVSGSCGIGSYVTAVNENGTVSCGADANSGGTVTGILAGAGLLADGIGGGLITSSGALSMDTAVAQARVSGFCGVGQFVTEVLQDGSVVCDRYLAGPGLQVSPAGNELYIPPGRLTEDFLFTPQAATVTSMADVLVRSHQIQDLGPSDLASLRITAGGSGTGTGFAKIVVNADSGAPASFGITLLPSPSGRPGTYATPEFPIAYGDTIDVFVRADTTSPVVIRDMQLVTRSSRVEASGIRSTGPISSNQVSELWISPGSFLVDRTYAANVAVVTFFPQNGQAAQLTNNSVNTNFSAWFLLPLNGIPASVYGAPVTLQDVTIYYWVSSTFAAINGTNIIKGRAVVGSDASTYGSWVGSPEANVASYTVPAPTPVDGPLLLQLSVAYMSPYEYANIEKVRVRYTY